MLFDSSCSSNNRSGLSQGETNLSTSDAKGDTRDKGAQKDMKVVQAHALFVANERAVPLLAGLL